MCTFVSGFSAVAHSVEPTAIRNKEEIMSSAGRAVVERYAQEFWIAHDMSVVDETHAPDHVYMDPALPGLPAGPEGVRERGSIYFTAVPDGRVEVLGWMDDGDMVLCRWRFSGTNTGDLMGISPTGRSVSVEGVHLCRVRNGLIAETRVFWDTLALFTQLGLVPEPVAA
jgi:predicted ester cyclase